MKSEMTSFPSHSPIIKALVESLTNGVAIFDGQRRVVLINPAMSKMTGLPREGFYVNELTRLFEGQRVNVERKLKEAIEERRTTHIPEILLVNFYYEMFIAPITDDDGNVMGGAIIMLDITQRKELELAKTEIDRQKNRFEILLESIGDGVLAIDRDWNITLWNRAAGVIAGWEKNEVLGRPFRDVIRFIRQRDRTENISFISDAMSTGEVRYMENHTILIRKDGGEIPVGDSAAPIFDKDGTITGVIVVFRDTSKEQEIERSKNDLVSLVTHELRGPASVIKGYLELYDDQWGKDLGETQKKYFREISAANDKLIELANSLLNVFGVDFGDVVINPEPVDMMELGDNALKQLELQIIGKKLQVEKEYGDGVSGFSVDKNLTELAFANLLSNAVKYTPDGGRVRLEIRKREKEVHIVVSDTGRGIPKDQQAKIFTKFFRASNVRGADGVGVGLHVLKSMLERAGCRIWFESEEQKGSTFTIAIPLMGMKKSGSESFPGGR